MSPDLNSLSASNASSTPLPLRNNPTSDSPPQAISSSMNSSSDLGSRRPSRSSPRAGRSSVSERRRSGLNLNLNESAVGDFPSDHRSVHAFRTDSPTSIGGSPIIGTGDPHHQRTPSLGELHQELEQEQEAQVNRLLQMIRSQQAQLQQLQQQAQSQQPPSTTSNTAVVDDSTPSSERSASFPPIPPVSAGNRTSAQLSSSLSSRRPSRPSSQATSPSLRPMHGASAESRGEGLEWITGANESPVRRGSRDESSFYQAEASMLNRENQMLRLRIRDLERQINELNTPSPSSRSGVTSMQPAIGSETESSDQPGPAVEKP